MNEDSRNYISSVPKPMTNKPKKNHLELNKQVMTNSNKMNISRLNTSSGGNNQSLGSNENNSSKLHENVNVTKFVTKDSDYYMKQNMDRICGQISDVIKTNYHVKINSLGNLTLPETAPIDSRLTTMVSGVIENSSELPGPQDRIFEVERRMSKTDKTNVVVADASKKLITSNIELYDSGKNSLGNSNVAKPKFEMSDLRFNLKMNIDKIKKGGELSYKGNSTTANSHNYNKKYDFERRVSTSKNSNRSSRNSSRENSQNRTYKANDPFQKRNSLINHTLYEYSYNNAKPEKSKLIKNFVREGKFKPPIEVIMKNNDSIRTLREKVSSKVGCDLNSITLKKVGGEKLADHGELSKLNIVADTVLNLEIL